MQNPVRFKDYIGPDNAANPATANVRKPGKTRRSEDRRKGPSSHDRTNFTLLQQDKVEEDAAPAAKNSGRPPKARPSPPEAERACFSTQSRANDR